MTLGLVHFNHSDTSHLITWADMRTSSWKPNYGDMLVCAAIIRQLGGHQSIRVGFGETLEAPVERAIIRGSTYLHNKFDFDAANRTLDSIDAPVTIVGLGCQNPKRDLTFLDSNDGAREFIARLNDKSVSLSVRGKFTADVVRRLGGKNIRITGCPSLFYSLKCPRIHVPELLHYPQRRLGISIHSGLSGNIFCWAPKHALAMHGQVIHWAINNAAIVSLFEQGVMLEYDVADQSLNFAERRDAARKIIERIDAHGLLEPEDLMAYMVSVKSIEEWLAKARDMDAIIGFRFHGNMVALLQGKPCYYYTYDSRLKEFCDIYALPQQDVTDGWRDPLEAIFNHDWDKTNNQIQFLFDELRAFYEENGFSCVLTPDQASEIKS